MDTNWCTVCGQHIDFSDEDLYCSQACRIQDELPPVLAADALTDFSLLSTPRVASPFNSADTSPTLSGSFSPIYQVSTCKISPPGFSLGAAAPTNNRPTGFLQRHF